MGSAHSSHGNSYFSSDSCGICVWPWLMASGFWFSRVHLLEQSPASQRNSSIGIIHLNLSISQKKKLRPGDEKNFPKISKDVEVPMIGLISVSTATSPILQEPIQIPPLSRYIPWALFFPRVSCSFPTLCLAGSFSSFRTRSQWPTPEMGHLRGDLQWWPIKEERTILFDYPIRIRSPPKSSLRELITFFHNTHSFACVLFNVP